MLWLLTLSTVCLGGCYYTEPEVRALFDRPDGSVAEDADPSLSSHAETVSCRDAGLHTPDASGPACDLVPTRRSAFINTYAGSSPAIRPASDEADWWVWIERDQRLTRYDVTGQNAVPSPLAGCVRRTVTWALCPDERVGTVSVSYLHVATTRIEVMSGVIVDPTVHGPPLVGTDKTEDLAFVEPAAGACDPLLIYNALDGTGRTLVAHSPLDDPADRVEIGVVAGRPRGLVGLKDQTVARGPDGLCLVGSSSEGLHGLWSAYIPGRNITTGGMFDGYQGGDLAAASSCAQPTLHALDGRWLLLCKLDGEIAALTSEDCATWTRIRPPAEFLGLGMAPATAQIDVIDGPEGGAVAAWVREVDGTDQVVLMQFDAAGAFIRAAAHAIDAELDGPPGHGGPAIGWNGREYLVGWPNDRGALSFARFACDEGVPR